MSQDRQFGDRWYNWQQAAVPFYLDLTLEACGVPFRKTFGLPFFTSIVYYRTTGSELGYQGSWLFRTEEGRAVGRLLVNLLAIPSFRRRFDDAYARAAEELESTAGRLYRDAEALHDASLEEMLDELDGFSRQLIDFYRLGAVTEPIQYEAEHLVRTYLQLDEAPRTASESDSDLPMWQTLVEDELADWDRDRIKDAVFVLSEDSYVLDVEEDLAECFEPSNSSGTLRLSSAKLEEHCAKYYWRINNYHTVKMLSPAHVEREMDAEHMTQAVLRARVKDARTRRAQAAHDRGRLMSLLPPYVRAAVVLNDECGGLLADRRKATIYRALTGQAAVGRAIARKMGTAYEDFVLLAPREVRDFVKDPGAYVERIAARREAFLLVLAPFPLEDREMAALLSLTEGSPLHVPQPDESSLAEGAPVHELLDELDRRLGLFVAGNEDRDRVVGEPIVRPASLLLEGVCRVISASSLDTLEAGEILVTTSTTPEYMPAIRRAAAIVTDQGGQTSHAAVIARELKKPCIVATGFATGVLQSGTVVRLDFESGEVRVMAKVAEDVGA
jgi:phosphohistidine swiveling domain-containing protein